jgi:glycerol-3-phosphate dehydrogenase
MPFSLLSRDNITSSLSSDHYDLLVIGGGITGCGIALDAALRGMKVALVEKSDFASGTSSRSTKLIHGGLRYLKQLEFKLVHDVGTERAIVYKNARHIVIPEKMLLPIVKNGSLGKGPTSLALWVYDYLAGVKKEEKRRMLNREQTLVEEPMLNKDKVTAGGVYYEYRTDDSRLVIELAKSAVSHGALCLNYTEVRELVYDDSKQVCGANITDAMSGKNFDIKATKVVNAAGPFVDLIRKTDQSLFGKRLQLTKGVHIVFSFERLPLQRAVYFDVADGRLIFAIPRDGITYVGTTDTVYNQDIDAPRTNMKDVEYLLKAVNDMFPSVQLKVSDVISSWAGLRPLIYEDGKSPSELSRKDEVIVSASGLISIAGGKLTGYRLMAKKITDLVAKDLLAEAKDFPPSTTATYQLSGGEFNSDEDLQNFLTSIVTDIANAYLPNYFLHRWVFRYGTNTRHVLELAETLKSRYTDNEQVALAAEMQYTFENEMAANEIDFAIRRTGMIYFDKIRLDKHLHFINEYFSALLHRSEVEKAAALKRFADVVKEVTDFK